MVPTQPTSTRPKITIELIMPDDPDERILSRVQSKEEDSIKIDVCATATNFNKQEFDGVHLSKGR